MNILTSTIPDFNSRAFVQVFGELHRMILILIGQWKEGYWTVTLLDYDTCCCGWSCIFWTPSHLIQAHIYSCCTHMKSLVSFCPSHITVLTLKDYSVPIHLSCSKRWQISHQKIISFLWARLVWCSFHIQLLWLVGYTSCVGVRGGTCL